METEEVPQEIFRKRLTVPKGFRNLLEGLTVEILRSNPADIYKFAAEYFDAKLKERQGLWVKLFCYAVKYLLPMRSFQFHTGQTQIYMNLKSHRWQCSIFVSGQK